MSLEKTRAKAIIAEALFPQKVVFLHRPSAVFGALVATLSISVALIFTLWILRGSG
jgi:hypothetical protein